VTEPVAPFAAGPDAHAETIEALTERLDTSPTGLTDAEASRRLKELGPNRAATPAAISPWAILANQIKSVVVLLLLAAVALAWIMGERAEAAAIGAVLVINVTIGFVTEWRARRAVAALLELDVQRAVVLRSGTLHAVDAEVLVPGDIIALDAGQRVPADGRIVMQQELRIDEAALTGESLPISKHTEPLPAETPLADRRNMVHLGTTALAGIAHVLVTATGGRTEIGRLDVLVRSVQQPPTPLEQRLDALGRRLVWLVLGIAAVVVGLGLYHGLPAADVLQTALALAVAAVPESLPAVATIALAIGVRRMAARGAIVRRLTSVESLGSATVICTDKTRTLTSGDMRAVRIWSEESDADLETSPPLTDALRRALEIGVLASRAPVVLDDERQGGDDPVDAALRAAAARYSIDRQTLIEASPQVHPVPFSSVRKFMAAIHRSDGGLVAYIKGAPSRVLERCASSAEGPLDARTRSALLAVNDTMAAGGLRVLALASGGVSDATETALTGLRFAGFVGLQDPPAAGVKETIDHLRAAGLRTVMVTGDQTPTAEAIARRLGMLGEGDVSLGGSEIARLSPSGLQARLARTSVCSRTTAEQKLAIVDALQANGEIVAMLGDGVNDAAALRKADIGVAMGGRGSDAAKAAAGIVLRDDRFETIAAAVEEGRIVFDNILKVVFYLFSCNVAEVAVVFVAGLAGWPAPLLPLQLLWLNIVTDTFPALALALEPGEGGVMQRPPRDPSADMLSRRFVLDVLLAGGIITASAVAVFLWLLRDGIVVAQTGTFTTLALAQVLHLGNARSQAPVLGIARITANGYALLAVALSVGLQLAAMYVHPLPELLHLIPLGPGQWLVVLVASLVPALAGQTLKVVRAGRRRLAAR
jgi:Ca2+-transporting ATPase